MDRGLSAQDAAAFVAIVGPTGSGKSELGLRVAEELWGEIVGCDALQVYRGLDIGTAKLPTSRRRGIVHHLIDVVSPDEEFSAARYIELSAPAIDDIHRRGRLPIVVGGTGLYLRALRFGLFPGPGRDEASRARLRALADRRGAEALHRILSRWDPDSADRIHPRDVVRLVRALEVCMTAKRPMSELMAKRRSPLAGFEDILVGLRPQRDVLAARVQKRVAAMYEGGLVEETERLLKRFGPSLPAFKAIGYRECLEAIAGRLEIAEAQRLTVTATMQYAKRQMTWFRKEEGIHWLDGLGDEPDVQRAVVQRLRWQLREVSLRHVT